MRCPICKIQFQPELSVAKPFCSSRCRTMDLGRWLDGAYTLPDVPDPEDDEIPEDDWAGKQFTEAEDPTDA